MIKEEIDKLTVEGLFEVRRITAEETMRLYDECKKTSEFFVEKAKILYRSELSEPTIIEALLLFLKGEIWNLKEKVELLAKAQQDNCILPSIALPQLRSIEPIWKYISDMQMTMSPSGSLQFVTLKNLIKETFMSLFHLETTFLHNPFNVEETFNKFKDKYEKEHHDALEVYLDEFESVDAIKASLREEYKNCIAVKCWKNAAHNVEKTISFMREQRCVESDLLPLFEYIAKCKMLEDKSNMHKFVSAVNNALTPRKKRRGQSTTTVNIYDCPAVNINQAQDVISEGGIKNVHNHKKQ